MGGLVCAGRRILTCAADAGVLPPDFPVCQWSSSGNLWGLDDGVYKASDRGYGGFVASQAFEHGGTCRGKQKLRR